MGKIRKFWMILGLENSLLRSDFAPFRLTVIRCVYPQNKLIFFGVCRVLVKHLTFLEKIHNRTDIM